MSKEFDKDSFFLFIGFLIVLCGALGGILYFARKAAPPPPEITCPSPEPCHPAPKCPPPPAPELSEKRQSCDKGWIKEVTAFQCVPYTEEELKIKEWVRKKRGEK